MNTKIYELVSCFSDLNIHETFTAANTLIFQRKPSLP